MSFSPAGTGSDGILQRLVQEVSDLLPEPVRQVMRLGAISTAFTPQLLQRLAGKEINTLSALETLEQYHFLNKEKGDWYSYPRDVREIISFYWRQPEHREEFQYANKIALDYFTSLAAQASPPASFVYQTEVVYHQLLQSEKAGLNQFSAWFEQACDQYQLGFAHDLLTRLTEASSGLSSLSSLAADHASYYQARLDFLFNRREELDDHLLKIASHTKDILLRARVGILLGQVWSSQYEWKESADILKSSLATLKNLNAWGYATKAMLALGDIYVDLVKYSGELNIENLQPRDKLDRFLYFLAFMPFLAFEWLKRKASFIPNRLSFSINYQDWILNYLLRKAENWYHKAWQLARTNGDESAALNALLSQGVVAIQQGREGNAKHIFAELSRLPPVTASRYRSAQVLYGRGQISFLAGNQVQAIREIQSALETFRAYEDTASIAQAACSLGNIYKQVGEDELAAQAFLESFHAFHTIQNPLSQTQIAWKLGELREGKQVSSSTRQQIESALEALTERQYLARFPDELLRRSRSLAYKVVFPIFYLSALIFGTVVSLIMLFVEVIFTSFTHGLSPLQFMLYLGIILSPVWTIELLYIVLGQVSIWAMSRKSLDLLGEQPDRIIITTEALAISRSSLREPIHIAWHEIQTLVSANFRFWKNPIAMVSCLYLGDMDRTFIIEGITNGYLKLSEEIQGKVNSKVSQFFADLTILANHQTYLAMLVAFLQAVLLAILKQIEITAQDTTTCTTIPLLFSPLLVAFIVNLIVLFPPVILWQVLAQRRFLMRHVKFHPQVLASKRLLGITILLSIIAGAWLVIAPVLKIGGEPAPQQQCIPQQSFLWSQPIQDNHTKENNLYKSANHPSSIGFNSLDLTVGKDIHSLSI